MKIPNCTTLSLHLLNSTLCNQAPKSASSMLSNPITSSASNLTNLIISPASSSLFGNHTRDVFFPTSDQDYNFLSDQGVIDKVTNMDATTTNNVTGSNLTNTPWTLSDISIAFILWSIVITSLVGNALVIFAIFKDRNLQSAQNYLICSLATADEMVSLFVMPPAAIMEIHGRWTLGHWSCYAWTSADVLSCTSSILHLVAIAFDRYWSVSDVNYSVNRSFTKIKFSIVTIWILSLIICLIPLFGWKDPDFDQRILAMECLISQDPKYQITATVTSFWLPTVVILAVYHMIYQVSYFTPSQTFPGSLLTRGS